VNHIVEVARPASLRHMNCSDGSPLAHYKRQYNLDVYEHGSGCYSGCCLIRTGCVAGCTCRHPIHSVCAQGCFLSNARRLYGNGLAMADRCLCLILIFDCLSRVWTNGRQSDLSAAAHAHCISYFDSVADRDSNSIAHDYKYTHADLNSEWDSDCCG